MKHHDHTAQEPTPAASFWRSRAGLTLIVFLAVAALLLGYEHRLHLFAAGMFPAVLLLGCVVMHFFMHGGHGGDGGHTGHGGPGNPQTKLTRDPIRTEGDTP